jgi:putative nucleotidyltransferase with HDIG domain
MSALSLDEVVAQLEHLPSLPAVVMELLNTLDRDDVDVSVLAKKVALDQALTAKTLKLANSPIFATQVKVTTIQQAITLLGFKSVRTLITAAGVAGCFPNTQCSGFDFHTFWRHSVATAVCGKVLARHLHINQDYAFTAGLLHDIGRLVLVTCFPRSYAETIAYRAAHDCQLLEAERAVLGVDHVRAGQLLAEHWNFSETMQKGIAGHHDPEAPGAGFLATIVHVADFIAHGLDVSGVEDDLVPPLSGLALNALGMDQAVFLHVFRETELHFEEISATLLM